MLELNLELETKQLRGAECDQKRKGTNMGLSRFVTRTKTAADRERTSRRRKEKER